MTYAHVLFSDQEGRFYIGGTGDLATPRFLAGPNLIRSGAYSVINRSLSGSGLAEIRNNKLERH